MRAGRKRRISATLGIAALTLWTLVVVVRCRTAEFGVPADVPAGGDRSSAPAAPRDALRRFLDLERRRGDGVLVSGNEATLLIDGKDTYDAMLASIASAQNHVHIETYIIQNDETGNRIANALIERAGAGVDVRVIYDGYGSTDSNAFWRRLRRAGVHVHEFNPPEPTENADILSYPHRDHRKLLIVDGRTGFTGGINFYDAYSSGSSRRREGGFGGVLPWLGSGSGALSWRDTHVRIEGPAVARLQRVFVGLWEEVEGDIDPEGLWPEVGRSGDEAVKIEVGVGGNDDPSETYAAYLDVFRNARERIWITQAYFVPNRAFLDAMVEAARRGVDVRVIVPGVTDVSLVLYASRRLYGRLLEAGVQIFEYQDSVLHAKTAVADGAWSIVGSSNLDPMSFMRNHEVDAVVVGRDFAEAMERTFLEDLGRTRQVTLAEWNARPLGYKALGAMAGWLGPWL